MVILRKRQLGKQTYYYLEHTIRRNGRVEKREKYLGKSIPKNIETLKKEFLYELYKERWHSTLNKIKQGFAKSYRQMPPSAKKEEMNKFAIHFTYDTQRIEG